MQTVKTQIGFKYRYVELRYYRKLKSRREKLEQLNLLIVELNRSFNINIRQITINKNSIENFSSSLLFAQGNVVEVLPEPADLKPVQKWNNSSSGNE